MLRGKIGTGYQTSLCAGILIIDVLTVLLGAERWRLLMSTTALLAALQLSVMLVWLPESPAWLLSKQQVLPPHRQDQNLALARRNLSELHGLIQSSSEVKPHRTVLFSTMQCAMPRLPLDG